MYIYIYVYTYINQHGQKILAAQEWRNRTPNATN